MTLTTGMLIAGKMSIGMETTETIPSTAINSARTTNVYGRRSASRTIHIYVRFLMVRIGLKSRVRILAGVAGGAGHRVTCAAAAAAEDGREARRPRQDVLSTCTRAPRRSS